MRKRTPTSAIPAEVHPKERRKQMRKTRSRGHAGKVLLAVAFSLAPLAQAQPWVSIESHTRYMALGDSISAGYGAPPAL